MEKQKLHNLRHELYEYYFDGGKQGGEVKRFGHVILDLDDWDTVFVKATRARKFEADFIKAKDSGHAPGVVI